MQAPVTGKGLGRSGERIFKRGRLRWGKALLGVEGKEGDSSRPVRRGPQQMETVPGRGGCGGVWESFWQGDRPRPKGAQLLPRVSQVVAGEALKQPEGSVSELWLNLSQVLPPLLLPRPTVS